MDKEILLARNLRTLRLKSGFSQKHVANILELRRGSYSYYENGKSIPDPETLTKLSQVYGVPVESFFEECIA